MLLGVLLFISIAFATEQAANIEPLEKVQSLIDKGLTKKNIKEIQKESLHLSPTDKEALYDNNEKKGAENWAPLNFFVGFGLGSYNQGDIAFGIVQSALDALGYSLLIHGIYIWNTRDHESEKDTPALTFAVVAMMYGIPIVSISRVMGLIRPFSYQRKYNRRLKTALNSNNISYSIDPLVVPKDGMPAIGLAFNLHFSIFQL